MKPNMDNPYVQGRLLPIDTTNPYPNEGSQDDRKPYRLFALGQRHQQDQIDNPEKYRVPTRSY